MLRVGVATWRRDAPPWRQRRASPIALELSFASTPNTIQPDIFFSFIKILSKLDLSRMHPKFFILIHTNFQKWQKLCILHKNLQTNEISFVYRQWNFIFLRTIKFHFLHTMKFHFFYRQKKSCNLSCNRLSFLSSFLFFSFFLVDLYSPWDMSFFLFLSNLSLTAPRALRGKNFATYGLAY